MAILLISKHAAKWDFSTTIGFDTAENGPSNWQNLPNYANICQHLSKLPEVNGCCQFSKKNPAFRLLWIIVAKKIQAAEWAGRKTIKSQIAIQVSARSPSQQGGPRRTAARTDQAAHKACPWHRGRSGLSSPSRSLTSAWASCQASSPPCPSRGGSSKKDRSGSYSAGRICSDRRWWTWAVDFGHLRLEVRGEGIVFRQSTDNQQTYPFSIQVWKNKIILIFHMKNEYLKCSWNFLGVFLQYDRDRRQWSGISHKLKIPTKVRQIIGEIQIQIFTTCQQKQYVSADARKKNTRVRKIRRNVANFK